MTRRGRSRNQRRSSHGTRQSTSRESLRSATLVICRLEKHWSSVKPRDNFNEREKKFPAPEQIDLLLTDGKVLDWYEKGEPGGGSIMKEALKELQRRLSQEVKMSHT